MPELAVIGIAFAVTFLAELPDKSMFASIVLATRYPALWVWAGAAAAFTVQMAIAVTAGQLLALLPHRVVNGVAAGLFVAGAVYLFAVSFRHRQGDGADAARQGQSRVSPWRVAGTAFGVIFVAEWGDITQFATANLAARYEPLLVLAGATLGLWAATAIAVVIGAKSLRVIPMGWVSRIAGTILLALGTYSAIAAVRG
ncbi:MAG: TMEM165/GDT1 family protein [Streptosporangiaceae bacterium]